MRIKDTYSLYKDEPFLDMELCIDYTQIPLGVKGVYVFYDIITDEVLYIGKAKDLRKRVYQYTTLGYGKASEKYDRIIDKEANPIGLLLYKSDENYLLEDELIKKCDPPYNHRREL